MPSISLCPTCGFCWEEGGISPSSLGSKLSAFIAPQLSRGHEQAPQERQLCSAPGSGLWPAPRKGLQCTQRCEEQTGNGSTAVGGCLEVQEPRE